MKRLISAAAATIAYVASAFGASAADLTIEYAVAPAAVPTMGEWAMILFALTLAGVAVIAVRRNKMGGSVASLGALIALGAVGLSNDSQAGSYQASLTGPGPLVVTLPNTTPHDITVTNNTGSEVTFTQFLYPRNVFSIAPQTTCDYGTPLAVGRSCVIALDQPI